jgi:curved DNA-binding protein CbpA
MECNKDEAARAKEIAEKKFKAKDITGAKKFALKAQNLFPGLEGIPQILATLDVYISVDNKINGEADWYGILGVDPLADDETVRKQYRKLALMLHPDKNKSIGADGAFKNVSEAWSLLSDKAKRAAYDQRRNAKAFQKFSTPTGGSSAPPGGNGFYNFTKSTTSNVRAHKNTSRAVHSSTSASSHKSKHNTFWTVCHRCKMQYEYLRVYLNHNLLCPNCHEPFFAIETAPPPCNSSKSSTQWNSSQQQRSSNHQSASKNTVNSGRNNVTSPNVGVGGFSSPDSYNQTNFEWGPFSRTTGASSTAQAASMVQQAYEKVKREREESQAATKKEEALRRKHHFSKKMGSASSSGHSGSAKRRKGMDDVGTSSYGRDVANQMGLGTGGSGVVDISGSKPANSETFRVTGITKPSGVRDVSQHEIRNLMMQKARMEIQKKLNEWKSITIDNHAVKEAEIGNEKLNEKGEQSLGNSDMPGQNKSGVSMNKKNGSCATRSFPGTSGAKTDAETLETLSINVPDPDFHDFDKDRTERSFGDNQVWSAYDDDDGMPRYYAMIHNVISLNPFEIQISWLNSKTNSELGPLNWVGSGFSKTCGDFRIGRHEINNSLNSFSHKVRWTKGTRGAICIYPRKGDVWALYRNWSPDWNELTSDEVIHKYDMVEVLEDYNEELGATVAPLVKVAGFKTVFHRHLDPREIRRIPRDELFRFSHHVPSHLLTGQEGPNAPKGCRELDPAATPVELLQIITDVKEQELMEDEVILITDNVVDNVEKANGKEMTEKLEKVQEEEEGDSKDIQEVEIVQDTEEKKIDEGMEHAQEKGVS